MKTSDLSGWLLPLTVLVLSLPVALGRVFGVAVSPDQSALASFIATLAGLVLGSCRVEKPSQPRPDARAVAPTHGSLHHRG